MIKKILMIISLFMIIFTLYTLTPSPMTPKGYFEEGALEIKKIYDDTSLYNSTCKENAILKVAIYYSEHEKYKKCKEWLIKRNQCLLFHPQYKGRYYLHVCDINRAIDER